MGISVQLPLEDVKGACSARSMSCLVSTLVAPQVLCAKLAMIHPTLMTDGGFDYVDERGLTKTQQKTAGGCLPPPPNPLLGRRCRAQPNLSSVYCSAAALLCPQVLRAKLAMIHPTLMTDGGFDYVEGEGLDADEAEDSRKLLPRTLAQLPGGGLVHGTIVSVQDQSQSVDFELIISHQVGAVITKQCVISSGACNSGARMNHDSKEWALLAVAVPRAATERVVVVFHARLHVPVMTP